MKIISWNVNGIKSTYKSGNLEELIKKENPDILCIQEIKTKEVPNIDGYKVYSYPASKSSNFYGTAIYTKVEPLSVVKGFEDEEFDAEGRVIKMVSYLDHPGFSEMGTSKIWGSSSCVIQLIMLI